MENLSKQRVDSLMEQHGGAFSAVVSQPNSRDIHKLRVCQVQSNVLSMLTRLRQLVLHPGLVPANYLEKLKALLENDDKTPMDAPAIQLRAADKVRLQGLLAQAIEDNEECPICFGILAEPRITSCSHSYCLAWYACVNCDRVLYN